MCTRNRYIFSRSHLSKSFKPFKGIFFHVEHCLFLQQHGMERTRTRPITKSLQKLLSSVCYSGSHQHFGGPPEAVGKRWVVGVGRCPPPARTAVPWRNRCPAALRVWKFYLKVGPLSLNSQQLRWAGGCNERALCRLIQHTKALMSTEEKLCIKVLKTLQEMLIRTLDFDEKVGQILIEI